MVQSSIRYNSLSNILRIIILNNDKGLEYIVKSYTLISALLDA